MQSVVNKAFMLCVVMLNVIMGSVDMLTVISPAPIPYCGALLSVLFGRSPLPYLKILD